MSDNMDQIGRRQLMALGMMAAGVALTPAVADAASSAPRDPDGACRALMEGNARYVAGLKTGGSGRGQARRSDVAPSQFPFATVLGCADSRVAPEVLFDTGIGDLFVVRVAGNAVDLTDHNVIGSLEYAHLVLGSNLIMVLGHTSCGAVGSALKTIDGNSELPGSIEHIVDAIRPAVRRSKERSGSGDALARATAENVRVAIERLKASHPILAPAVDSGRLRVVGGIYDLASGAVTPVE
jgi:carbonic anhydrase